MSRAWTVARNVEPREGIWRSLDLLKNLELKDVPKPIPGPKQVLLKIQYATLNARDPMVISRDSVYPVTAKDGLVPCSDGAGVVESVGPDSAFSPGDRVVWHFNSWQNGDVTNFNIHEGLGGGDIDGTLRTHAVVDDFKLVRIPEGLSTQGAACLPTALCTAANALLFGPYGRVKEGMTVLTQGTGGVSTGAIQIAAALGATVIATSSSEEKLALVKSIGATHTVNYKTHPEWSAEVLRITGGKGVDHVVEVGGAGTILESLKSTRYGGQVSICGILTPPKEEDLVPHIMYGAKTVRGVLGGGSQEMLEELVKLFAKHRIEPVVAKVFEFEQAKEAFELQLKQLEPGKIVVKT